MTKRDFLMELEKKLSGLPKSDLEEHLNFYGEMLDDRMEEGLSEEEAVAAVGSTDDIAAQIIRDIPLTRLAKEKIKPKRRIRAWEIVLLILGSPIWLSLAVAAFVVILSLYAVIWSLIVALWSVFAAITACAPYGVGNGILHCMQGNGMSGIALVGAGFICAGLAIFLFFGCVAATKGMAKLTGKIALGIKICFVGKEKEA